MNISIALPAMAPQSTGHSASLPPDPVQPDIAKTVTPASNGAASGQTGKRQTGNGDQQETAPPSAIQIKIMEMLDQQARELEQHPEP